MAAILLDSNIIIYGAQPGGEKVRRFISEYEPSVSVVSKVETLGYHALDQTEKANLERFFAAAVVLPVSEGVIAKAIELRQRRSISLGDSLIAATALTADVALATHNVIDFSWIEELEIIDPLKRVG